MSGPGGWGPPGSSPWADPATPTQPGPPYPGPPPTGPPAYGPPAYGPPGQPWGAPQWGPPPYGYPPGPRRPQRPGQVVTAAVLAFAQALVVLVASLYLWFFASVAELAAAEAGGIYAPGTVDALASEGTALALVQLLSAVLLIGAGVWALNSRRRAAGVLLQTALGLQVLLAVYWAVRLNSEVGGYETEGTIAAFALFFAAGPLVGLGMLLAGPGRRWFDGTARA
ncbi:hypothetical protein [Blastococcus tunisiensis]|uniref:Uncharacterized protein n=1 Tax=Blastococcus tunisiensis TaxID=1798228 RepID=A0A1I1VS90_9ACTN|nr:hypothetical protein [Blastococcus sp. DSM 46838]SFD83893.1 hypothetical protein SAMN05216574_10117 [Blastococcus sp. DSM 46838]